MQFVIIGLDGNDKGAPDRRQAVRRQHLERGQELTASGNLWYGALLLNDDGTMRGSMYVMNFLSEIELQEYLSTEPYVIGDVWQDIAIHKSAIRDPWQFNHSQAWYEEKLTDN
jgi:uncharacterized protein YciI